jgi:hypothetical protein
MVVTKTSKLPDCSTTSLRMVDRTRRLGAASTACPTHRRGLHGRRT